MSCRGRTTSSSNGARSTGSLHERIESLVFPATDEPCVDERAGGGAGAGRGGGTSTASAKCKVVDGIDDARKRLRESIASGDLALEAREYCEALLRKQLNPTRVTKEEVIAELVEFAYARVSPAVRAESSRAVTEALIASLPELRAEAEERWGNHT